VRLTAAIALAALAGCSAPSDPTWTRDVKPILQANCVKCHGPVARGGAPDGFRLDTYSAPGRDDGRAVYGASSMARFVHLRTHAGDMPPVAPLSGVQIETLENWFETGAPQGGPDPNNAAPSAELSAALGDLEDGFLDIEILIRDPDFDIVTGTLRAVPGGGEITRELYSGRNVVRWDAQALAEASYELVAVLNDEHETVEVSLGDYEVVHPGGNAAPSMVIGRPRPDELIVAGASPEVVFDLQDANPADTLTVSVLAERGDESIEIASLEDAPRGVVTLPIDTASVEAGGNWRIRIAVSDGTVERSAIAAPVVFAGGATDLTFTGDIIPLFGRSCTGCHSATPTIPTDAAFNLLDYQEASMYLGKIYRRVVQEQTMPPRSIEIIYDESMSIEDRRLLAGYILAGAPCPADEPGCPEEEP
jgi:mono/diheme cytochrome c family protein